jgi:hypothetical protein
MTLAADEKHRLEVKQRAVRKERKDAGEIGKVLADCCFALLLLLLRARARGLGAVADMTVRACPQANRRRGGFVESEIQCWIGMPGCSKGSTGPRVTRGCSKTAERGTAVTTSSERRSGNGAGPRFPHACVHAKCQTEVILHWQATACVPMGMAERLMCSRCRAPAARASP